MDWNRLKSVLLIRRIQEGLALTIGGALLFFYCAAEHLNGGYAGIGQSPYLFPGLAAALLLCCGVTLLIKSEPEAAAAEEREPKETRGAKLCVVMVLALSLVYCYLMPVIGFILSTALYLFALFLIMGERRWGVLAFGSAVISAIIYLIFAVLLGVMLP